MLDNSNIKTHHLIANILSFDNHSNDLKKQLESKKIDWENLVKIASSHLVLTTVYCRLKQKELLHFLPVDLKEYLEELTTINRNRNRKLIAEAQPLISILKKHNIDHVFIKGMSLLLGGYYKDIGERMIGDFDILIHEKDLELVFDLFKKEGYDELVDFNYKRTNFRHLPRQVNKKKLAAIELHRHILNPSHRTLIPVNDVFANKRTIDNISIPNIEHLNIINVLTSQLNDHNYFYNTINFKNSYDSLVLGLDKYLKANDEKLNSKYVSHYIILNSSWFDKLDIKNHSFINKLKKKNYVLKMKFEKFGKIISIINYIYFTILNRLNLIAKNKSYRNYLIKSKILQKLRHN